MSENECSAPQRGGVTASFALYAASDNSVGWVSRPPITPGTRHVGQVPTGDSLRRSPPRRYRVGVSPASALAPGSCRPPHPV